MPPAASFAGGVRPRRNGFWVSIGFRRSNTVQDDLRCRHGDSEPEISRRTQLGFNDGMEAV